MRVAFRADGHWSIRVEIRTSDTHPGDSSCDLAVRPDGQSVRVTIRPIHLVRQSVRTVSSCGQSVRADCWFVRLNSLARADR